MRPIFYSLFALLLLVWACQKEALPPSPQAKSPQDPPKVAPESPTGLTPLEMRFDREKQPFAYVLPHMPPPVPVPGISAEDCGKCHETIYQEWKTSTHAHALSDLQYQAELA